MTCGGNGALNLWKYSYRTERKRMNPDTSQDEGVAGTIKLLGSEVISPQPVLAFDWNADKEGLCVFASLDQTVKIGIVTKLKTL